MTLIFITHHNENVLDFEKEKDPEPPKQVWQKSKFMAELLATSKGQNKKHKKGIQEQIKVISVDSTKDDHRTFGFATYPKSVPDKYLKKNDGIRVLKVHSHKCPVMPPIPEVPKVADIRKKVKKPPENLIRKNIIRANTATPGKPKPEYIDTRDGHKQHILTGLAEMPNFAKVPKWYYSKKYPKKLPVCEDEVVESVPDGVKLLSLEERIDLIKGLKKTWTEMQRIYQGLPVLTDTIPKKIRKNTLEMELRQLEKDILLIEENPLIYVCVDEKK